MLGKRVKDVITGMVGIAIQKIEYLNGCIQYMVQPEKLKDNVPAESRWFDVEQLKLTTTKTNVKIKKKSTGGPAPTYLPTRSRI